MRVCSGAARVRTHHTQATMIFRAKANRVKRGSLSVELAAEFGITSKAVRDIWNLRTWTWTTLPYWTQADHDDFLPKHLCEECKVEHKAGNVRVLSDACARCANPPPLGRPVLDRTVPFGSIGFSATAHVEEAQAVMETEASAGAWAGAATDPAHHFAQSCLSELADGGPMVEASSDASVMETEASAGAWAGAATDPAHHFAQSCFSELSRELADGGPMVEASVMETEASAGAWAGAATDPADHFVQSCFSELTDGGPAGPTFKAIPSFSDIFCVASPQELLDGKGISESEA